MVDFITIATRCPKRGVIEIYPKFIVKPSEDLMIRGGDFYAVWVEDIGLWSTEEQDAIKLIDRELDIFYKENKSKFIGEKVSVLHLWDAETGMIDRWHKFCQSQMPDSFVTLNEKLIFANSEVNKKDYASIRLNYSLGPGDISAYDKLIGTLYSPDERKKIEWAIGAIISGDSKTIQKFMVLYGSAGTGKSTILNIIQDLFNGYCSVFDARALGSSSNAFALEAFKSNPLVAIQHDGDLSRIEDNTRLNSLVSHETMTVNEKFKSTYSNRFKCFLFMGTNKPVKITDAKSGLIRRLIDVSPSGKKLDIHDYNLAINEIKFELGAIAYHCLQVYNENKYAYDTYMPTAMMGASNDFYNFVSDSYFIFKDDNGTSLKRAWDVYKAYCEDAKIQYPFSKRIFKEELRNYFKEYYDRYVLPDGTRVRSYYYGFKGDQFDGIELEPTENIDIHKTIELIEQPSKLDIYCKDCLAQYATDNGTPHAKWSTVTTTLNDIDTSRLHYVKLPENHIVIDFDIPDEHGNKSFAKNLEAASKFPATYAEVSKSGCGIHLHYIYDGDPTKLSRVYDDYVEVKVFTGNSSLRRRLTKCNNIDIATLNSGLPLKGADKVVNTGALQNEKAIRTVIKRNLNKEYHSSTTPSINFIYKVLEDAYENGVPYDVTDLRSAVLAFAVNSTHQSTNCVKLVGKMKFKSAGPDIQEYTDIEKKAVEDIQLEDLVFFDCEVYKNLFIVVYKHYGDKHKPVALVNPTSEQISNLTNYPLVGFNNRRYDNHIFYARMLGYTNEQLYWLSQKIITKAPDCFFREAYNLSYTDIYDFSSEKKSLKKFEIALGIHHKECDIPWDQPVPEDKIQEVVDYCINDVIATEKVFISRLSDFKARKILAKLAGMTPNDPTNTLSAKFIFGNDKNPQTQFNYRNMGDTSEVCDNWVITNDMTMYRNLGNPEYTLFREDGKPIFPGYEFKNGVSTYRGEKVGEGGEVWAKLGLHVDVVTEDIAGMHPASAIAEELFGIYTKRFEDLVNARLAIKHVDYELAKTMLDGILAPFLTDEDEAKDLATALKIVVNSVYGLTAAHFPNKFRDERNIDNIVAKRGALFMINLRHEVEEKGYTVAHIKTDSIKIPNATPEILEFVVDYGKMYGYTFEVESRYKKMCLVNDAVYIAKEQDEYDEQGNLVKKGGWSATGKQFAVPYVFKTLFSKEKLTFDDFCVTNAVSTALYLDFNETLPNVTLLENKLAKLDKKIAKETNEDILSTYAAERASLLEDISKGHDRHFVGKVGAFIPVKAEQGGGILVRQNIDKLGNIKYDSATGADGYRWIEAELLRPIYENNIEALSKEIVDKRYFTKLTDDAKDAISQYCDFEWFVA